MFIPCKLMKQSWYFNVYTGPFGNLAIKTSKDSKQAFKKEKKQKFYMISKLISIYTFKIHFQLVSWQSKLRLPKS